MTNDSATLNWQSVVVALTYLNIKSFIKNDDFGKKVVKGNGVYC